MKSLRNSSVKRIWFKISSLFVCWVGSIVVQLNEFGLKYAKNLGICANRNNYAHFCLYKLLLDTFKSFKNPY